MKKILSVIIIFHDIDKLRSTKLLFFCFFLFSSIFSYGQERGEAFDTTFINTFEYSGVLFGKNFPLNIKDDKTLRWTPSIEDVIKAECLLKKFIYKLPKKSYLSLKVGTCPLISANLSNYIRQYMGIIDNKGRKIILINFIWKEEILYNEEWKVNYINVLDGCSYYWSLKVNIDNNKCFDLLVDGLRLDKNSVKRLR